MTLDGPELGHPHSIHCKPTAFTDDPGAQVPTHCALNQAVPPVLQEARMLDGLTGSEHETEAQGLK